jgi:CHAT domain-containing protein
MDTHAWADQRHLAARQRSLEHRLRRLGALLLDGIPEDGWKVLWIAPDDGLYHLPWSALEDRHGRPLIERGAMTLVPGSGIAAALLGSSNPAPRTIALAGAGGDTLELVDAEIRDLGRLLPGSTRRQATTRQQLLDVLADHEMVHVAGHALFLDGVPGASGLRLEDGFVTVHDLAAARIRARTVCFGVCSGLRITEKEPNRFEGFLRALLGSGVRTVVGPIARVRDHVAHAFALSFHSSLKDSSHPALAFREAVTELRGQDPHPATWGNFHIYGDGRPWRTA